MICRRAGVWSVGVWIEKIFLFVYFFVVLLGCVKWLEKLAIMFLGLVEEY